METSSYSEGLSSVLSSICISKGKVKVIHPRTGHEGPEEE